MPQPKVVELTEYQSLLCPPHALPDEVGKILSDDYKNQIDVEFPTYKTDEQWKLTAKGWVGHIPLTPEIQFVLQPKVQLDNLFRMLEIAYRLDFKVEEGLVGCRSLKEFYERLAHILAKRILERSRKGFYRAYRPESEMLPYVRGRLDVRQTAQSPGRVRLNCHYQNHTADVEENQILAWTLLHITRSGLCTERTLPTLRRAYRSLQGRVTVQPQPAKACLNRLYNRLNEDYQPLHALCRFFLEQSGPSHQLGDRLMLPFLVDMARLYERFVAEWLSINPPAGMKLKPQERVYIGQTGGLHFQIDLVLIDGLTGETRYVLDTKYKTPDTPSTADISQVVTYAELKKCREAILIYPASLTRPLDIMIGEIRVRSVTFALDGDLEQQGRALRNSLTVE